jgi:hypothetical protein
MLRRSIAALVFAAWLLSSYAHSEELHERWLKFFAGEWTGKADGGNAGKVTFQSVANIPCLIVMETNTVTGYSTISTMGWQSAKGIFGGTGFDSEGACVETCFTKITDDKLTGQRVRTSKDRETKESWEIVRLTPDAYELTVNTEGKEVSVLVTRR